MKKLLFIGDLRTAQNYGAVATTEALIHLLDEEKLDIDIRYIDYRSLYSPTPANGFPLFQTKKKHHQQLNHLFKRMIPEPILEIYKRKKNSRVNDFVPYKYAQYEKYYNLLISGTSLQFEKKMLEWADVVFINGEGNIVHGTDAKGKYRMGARYILFMAWLAKVKYKKTTLIVNHTVDPDNYNAFEMIEKIYPILDVVFVREKLSLPLLEKHGVNNALFVPDALFSYKDEKGWKPTPYLKSQIDFSKPYICIGDSSGLRNRYNCVKWDVISNYVAIIEGLKEIVPQIIFVDGFNGNNHKILQAINKTGIGSVNIKNTSYRDLFHVLGGAELFISGRWHASILSVLANTPILLWGSDSHKTKSLYPLLDYNYRFFEVSSLPVNIPELVSEAKKIIDDSTQIKSKLKEKVALYSDLSRDNVKILRNYVG